MARTIEIRGMDGAEYERFKADFAALGIKASFQYHKQKYCYGSVCVRPPKSAGWLFTLDQVATIRRFLLDRGMYSIGLDEYDDHVFRQSFGYLYVVCG